MRIRKNAKTSAFLQTLPSNININNNNNINNIHQTTTLCLLNQSPWDIISFPSSPSSPTSIHLFDDYVTCYNVNAAAHWNSPDSTTPIQSVASTKNAYEWEYDIINKNVDEKIRDYEAYNEDKLGFMKGCVKKKEDIINVVDIQNDTVWSTNKKAQPIGRKKRAVAVTPKQNEFYYYSGFGPSWGKKRGCTTFNACDTTSSVYDGDMDVDVDLDEDKKRAESDTTTSAMMRTVWSCQVAPGKGDFDYMGEYEECDDGKQEKTVKKKWRKPMKARSLKSLM